MADKRSLLNNLVGHHSPYAVLYGGSKLRTTPNPFRSEATLTAELQRTGARIWDTDIGTLDEAEIEAQAAGRAHEGRVIVYDQSTGEAVHTQVAARARTTRTQAGMKGTTRLRPKKLDPWNGPERWEGKAMGEGYWVEIHPLTETTRVLKNDAGDRWTETAEEVEAHRRRLRAAGSVLVKLSAPVAMPARMAKGAGLELAILDAARELGRGKTGVPIRITELRARVGARAYHHRTDFDEATRALHEAGKIVLAKNDNAYSLTEDDRRDAVWVGDSPRHLVYVS
ncbi:MAG: hypothetical protein PHX83_14620 [Acidobacteriia bacterium]|nr:hypothetical protein [Terriglobia bacterium]